jgi:hypothetical protein
MISLALPLGHRRTVVRSFWLVISLTCAIGVWLVGSLLNLPISWALGVIGGTAVGLLVFVQEEFVHRLYRAWNSRLVRPLARLISTGVMGICLFIIFVATGRAGSRLRLGGHADTTWELRTSLPDNAYELPFASQGRFSIKTGWIRGYLRWAIRSGNVWSISLIPFLCFLRMLSTEEQTALEGNIYTLF